MKILKTVLFITLFFVLLYGFIVYFYDDKKSLKSISIEDFKISESIYSSVINFPKVIESADGIQQAFVMFEDHKWKVLRSFPVNKISIQVGSSNNGFDELKIDARLAKDIYLLDIGTNEKGDLLLVGYDVVQNVPSGRRLTGVTNGLDVFVIDSNSHSIKNIASGVPISGMDEKIYTRFGDNDVVICSNIVCYTISYSGEFYKWNSFTEGFEIVEAEFIDNSTIALILRRKYDDRAQNYQNKNFYSSVFLKGIISKEEMIVDDFDVDGIPYNLNYSNDVIYYNVARNVSGFKNLLEYDFKRMNNNGLIDIGSNNLEGRIAWSQVYYLNGLIALIDDSVNEDLAFNGIRERVKQEINGVLASCESNFPYLYTQRYSVDREPLLYALHLGRIASLVKRAHTLGIADSSICLQKINEDLKSMDSTVEKLVLDSNGLIVNLQYGQGYPFWADGANVPFNYISGYLDGLYQFGSYYERENLLSLIVDDQFNEDEYPYVWNYWGGVGNNGWSITDGISINTPEYSGNQNMKAHITYRTMDAVSLMNCFYSSFCMRSIDDELIEHFKLLTKIGYLLPFINDVWNFHGFKVKYDLNNYAVLGYARSANHWEFYNQVFVLDQMSEYLSGN